MSAAGSAPISATVVRWVAPTLEPLPAPSVVVEEVEPEQVAPPSWEELKAIRDKAHEAGYQAGHEEGMSAGHAQGFAQGHSEVRRLIAQIEGILDNFTRPLARLESEVSSALGALAVRIAGHLVGRACATDPSLLLALVNQALEEVSQATREVELRLHPDDLTTLTSSMAQDVPRPWLAVSDGVRLIRDPSLGRGELRVHTESVRIDGTLNARLERALEQVMQQAERAP